MMAMSVHRSASPVGHLQSIHRYPVKSLVGEALKRALVDARGMHGDRAWCVRDLDGKFGSGKSTRRFRKMNGLLSLVAHYEGDVPVIEFESGRTCHGDDPAVHDALSTHVGRPVTLSREAEISHFDEGPIHLLTTASLRRLEGAHGQRVDVRRLRPNLVLDTGDKPGFVEDAWVGRRIAIGSEVVLTIRSTMPRCVMVNLAQKGLAEDRGLLLTATNANRAYTGVVADVLVPGIVEVRDDARLLD